MAGDFSDEEWDISDDQLQDLEQKAILSTQQQRSNTARNGSTHSGSTLRLDTPVNPKNIAHTTTAQRLQNVQQPNEDSFDNPALDEDGIPLVVEEQRHQQYANPKRADETTQREQWRLNRFAQKNGPPSYRPSTKAIPHQAYHSYQQQNPQYGRPLQLNSGPIAQKTPVGTQLTPSSQNVAQQPPSAHGPLAIRTELEKERREREVLQQRLEALTKELHTAKGEAVVIRSKNANDVKLAERQLNAAKRQMQEQVTKHQVELEKRNAAYTALTDEHKFALQDLNEQASKVKNLQRQMKETLARRPSTEVIPSPRKNLQNTLRDGFDDDEILLLSPSRSPAKRRTPKPITPSKKRKHPVNNVDEPTLTLRLSQPQDEQPAPPKDGQPKTEAVTKVVKDHQTEEHLKLLQAVLTFRPPGSQDTLVECLVCFKFPSDSHRSLSSLMLFETSRLEGSRFPGDLLGIFARLLTRCSKEDYFKPLNTLLAAVRHILDLEPTIVDGEVVRTLVRPLQDLAMINPRKRWNLDKNKLSGDNNSKPKLDPDIDTTECLELLFVMASLILDEPDLIQEFWRCVDTELVLLMLTPFQAIPDLHLMLELLSTSIQPTTFGNICTAEEQARMETYAVDKACFLLWDPPRRTVKSHPRRPYSSTSPQTDSKPRKPMRPPKDPEPPAEPPPTRLEICNLRLQVLSLLSSLLTSGKPHPHSHPVPPAPLHHGTSILLFHPTAIARLVRLLYDEVSLLSANLQTHALHVKIVNTTTTLLHHILLSPAATDPKGTFELQRALSGTLVGVHRFRVVMTRIAFREEKVGGAETQKDCISEESVIKATEVLEEYVTPDEAVQLVEVLGRGEGEDIDVDVEEMYGREQDGDPMDADGDEEAERAEADVMAGVER